jgi:hypothetical protein
MTLLNCCCEFCTCFLFLLWFKIVVFVMNKWN